MVLCQVREDVSWGVLGWNESVSRDRVVVGAMSAIVYVVFELAVVNPSSKYFFHNGSLLAFVTVVAVLPICFDTNNASGARVSIGSPVALSVAVFSVMRIVRYFRRSPVITRWLWWLLLWLLMMDRRCVERMC